MNFLIKCSIQHVLSRIPKGERLNLWLQINGTKFLPASDWMLKEKIDTAQIHLENYKKYNKDGNTNIHNISSFEFGAGFDLIVPLVFSHFGLKNIYCVDIKDKASIFLVKDILNRLSNYKGIEGFVIKKSKDEELTNENFRTILKEKFNLHYKAPMDASKTDFEDNSIDLIATTATFEHIPRNSLKNILKESFRILKPGGVFSNAIDYKDHWAYVDDRLSYYNFLQYNERRWKLYNPDLNYQNRMRHKDYIELFESAGFDVCFVQHEDPTEKDKIALSELKINDFYKNNYTFDELSVLSSSIVVTKK